MEFYYKNKKLAELAVELQKEDIFNRADSALGINPVHITDSTSEKSAGGKHDYFSQGDYHWPNPDTLDGLPYIRRDGESNPDVFKEHRKILRFMRTTVANLTAAFLITKDTKYAAAAEIWLKEFFLDEETYMEPRLLYTQAILGNCTGRGIGIIDTLHLAEVPVAAQLLHENGVLKKEIHDGLKNWFSKYLNWLCTHEYGKYEMNYINNHSVCWHVQAASYARFTENNDVLKLCIDHYKNVILPNQMAQDGSFPLEIKRTKPYGYSIFVVDNMASLCQLLSTSQDNLFEFTLPDGKNMKKGLDFLYPFLENKASWPFAKDIQHFDEWPIAMSFMLFAASAYDEEKWAQLYKRFYRVTDNDEVRRNTAIRVPWLWL